MKVLESLINKKSNHSTKSVQESVLWFSKSCILNFYISCYCMQMEIVATVITFVIPMAIIKMFHGVYRG